MVNQYNIVKLNKIKLKKYFKMQKKKKKIDMCNQPGSDCLHELEAIETNMLMFLGNERKD